MIKGAKEIAISHRGRTKREGSKGRERKPEKGKAKKDKHMFERHSQSPEPSSIGSALAHLPKLATPSLRGTETRQERVRKQECRGKVVQPAQFVPAWLE